jgi:hypothetical protein
MREATTGIDLIFKLFEGRRVNIKSKHVFIAVSFQPLQIASI